MRLRVEPRDAVVGIPTGVFTQLVLVPLLYLPIFWIFGHRDLSQDAKDLTNKANGAGVVLLILLVVIGAPIVEELFFRGFLMGALERTSGKAWALWISALLFGAGHFEPLQTSRRSCCSGSSWGISCSATTGSGRRSSPTWGSMP